MLFKKDQTAALTYTCSPRVTLTHILLCAITIEMTSHLFSSSNLEAYGLKKTISEDKQCNPGFMHKCVSIFVSREMGEKKGKIKQNSNMEGERDGLLCVSCCLFSRH